MYLMLNTVYFVLAGARRRSIRGSSGSTTAALVVGTVQP